MTSLRWIRTIAAAAAVLAVAIPTSSVAAMPAEGARSAVATVAAAAPAAAAVPALPGEAAPAAADRADPDPSTAANPASADPAAVSLAGTLRVAIADDFAGGRSQTLYSIDTTSGSTPITVSGSGVERLDGALVHATGRRQADGSVAVATGSIVVERTAAANPYAAALGIKTGAAATVTPAAPATRKIAVIIADYSDLAGYPATVAQAQSTFTSSASSVHSYFDATSRGRLSTTTDVLGPWHLGISQCPGGTSSWGFTTSLNAALTAARAHGKDLTPYDDVVLWTRQPCQQGWAGVGSVPGRYVQIVVDWATYGTPISNMVASHELEHNLGLYHSNGLACFDGAGNQVSLQGACVDDEYADQYTTMGSAGASDYPLLDADRLASLGWLDAGESKTVNAVGTYSLVPVYSATPGVRLLRISRPTPILTGEQSGSWTLEIRSTASGTAFDKFAGLPYSLVTTGVTIRYSEDQYRQYGMDGPSYLIDTVPDGSRAAGVDFWDSPLQPGGTFSDPVGGFTITVNSAGASGATVTIGDTMAPGAPLSLEATAIPAGGAQLDWQAATDNLRVAHYRIYRDGSRIGEVSGTTLTYTDPPAGFGGVHNYGVTAVDTAGLEGAAATASATLVAPPTAPLSVVGAAGNGAVRVAWSAPAAGAPITGYAVTSHPGGATCTTTGALYCFVEALTNGTLYTFTVTATNSVGTGPASDASAAVTPLPVPGRGTSVSGSPGDTTVAVTWTAPADAGSSPISGYTVKSSPGGMTCSTGGSIGCTVTGLTDGVAYTFTVRASNALGTGLPSDPSPAVTPSTRPGPPTGVVAVGLNQAALVSWNYPASDGGSAVAAYDVVASPGGGTCHTTGARSCTVPGLTNRLRYTFVVTAMNAVGTSDPSAASAAAMPLAGATYVTVTPNRLVDSRSGARLGLGASLTYNNPVSFQVTGRSVDPRLNIPTGAVAVTGNLTAVNEGYKGYFSLTPDKPTGKPATSTLNFPAGDIRANAVTVPLGAGGKLWITYVGSPGKLADVVFDVTGYFVGNSGGATYLPLTPNRILDSRSPLRLGMPVSLTSGTPASFQVTGRSADATLNVPSNATAVVGNLTAVNEGSKGYFSLTPYKPTGTPGTSTLNFPAGDIRANGVTVPLGSGGKLWVTFVGGAGAKADVIFDVTGYFVPDTSGATYVALTPNRLVDSRPGTRLGLKASLTANKPATFAVTGQSSDVALNVPLGAVGITGNLTAVDEGAKGYYALTPDQPAGVPLTSTLNFPQGDIRANTVTIPLPAGGALWITFVGRAGTLADVVFDVSGYFTMS